MKTKNKVTTIALLAALGLAQACTTTRHSLDSGRANLESLTENEPAPIAASVSSTWRSKYLLGTGFVAIDNPVIQSDITVSSPRYIPGLSANVWTSYNPLTQGVTEADGSLTYVGELSDNFDFLLTAGYYSFQLHDDVTIGDVKEVGVGVNTKNLPEGFPTFSLTAYQLFSDASKNGQRYILSANKGFSLTDTLSVSTSVEGQWNNHYFTTDSKPSIVAGDLGVTLDLGNLKLNAGYRQQLPLDKGNFDRENVFSFGGRFDF